MSNLDINTPLGQESLEEERKMAKLFQRHHVWQRYVNTNKAGKAAIDAVLLSYDNILGLVEQKSRKFTLEEFKSKHKMEWLVTYKKIIDAEKAAELMQLPLWGFLWMIPSRCLLRKILWTPDKGRIAKLYTDHTRTQRTINGGSIVRENAYIDMSDAELIK